MISFQEIGGIIRLIFIYRLNSKKMDKAHKLNPDKEFKKDFSVGTILFLGVIIIGIIQFLKS